MTEAAAASAEPTAPTTGPEITDVTPVSAVTNPQSLAEGAKGRDRMARAVALMTGKKTADAPPETTKLEAVTPEPETPAEEPASEPEPVIEQKPGESDAKFQARLAQALADLQKRDVTIREQGEAQKKLAADLDALRAQLKAKDDEITKFTTDANYALKAHGGFDSVAKRVLNQEIKPPTPEELIREQVTTTTSKLEQELAALKAEREAEKAAAAEAAQKAEAERQSAETRARDLETVKARFKVVATKYPVASAFVTPEALLDVCYRNQIAEPDKALEMIEAETSQNLEAILGNAGAVAAYLKSRPKVRETLLSAIGAKEQSRKTPSSSEGPRAIGADVVSAPTTPKDRPMTKDERMKSAVARLTGGSQ
jgi:hypothetical protein